MPVKILQYPVENISWGKKKIKKIRLSPAFLWIDFKEKAQTPLSEFLEALLVANTDFQELGAQ